MITDSSTSDTDVINAAVSNATAAPRISGVETINITGPFLTTGLALSNVTGATTLNVNTELAGGTATVTDAFSLNASTINAGANIATLDITSSSAGTRDIVTVDAGSGDLNLTGNDGGVDTYTASVGDGATVTLDVMTANDTLNLTIAGDVTIDNADAAAAAGADTIENLNITSAEDATVTLTTTGAAAEQSATNIDFAGAGNYTVVVADATDVESTLTAITGSGAGTVTLQLTTIADDEAFNDAAVDFVEINAAADDDTYVFNQDSTVVLNGDISTTAADITNIDINNTDGDLADGAGTLSLTVSESQTSIIAVGDDAGSSNAGAIVLTALADDADDTADGAVLTLEELDLQANRGAAGENDTLVILGSDDLTITLLDNAAGTVVSAANMTGALTISDITAAASVFGGVGDDSITSDANAAFTVRAGAGDDTVNFGTTVNTAATIFGEAGNDTLTGGDAADTINGGEGNDTIDGEGGADTIVTGAGSDTVIIVSTEDGDTVSDFVLGTDTLRLTGAANAAIDLSDVTVSSAAYAIDNNFDVTLTGNTATDITGSVQLGASDALFTFADNTTNVAGDADDFVTALAATTVTVTLGAGSDTFYLVAGSDDAADAVTISDFTAGEDKIVLIDGAGNSAAGISLAAAKNPTAGAYSDLESGEFDITLTGVTATDVSGIFQLGDEDNTFTAATAQAYVGGDFADHITVANAGGATITGGGGADILDSGTGTLGNTFVYAAGDSIVGAHDEISNFNTTADGTATTLDMVSTNIATSVGNTTVQGISGATVSNGVITAFEGIDNTVNATTLDAVLAFLAENVSSTDTVAFAYVQDEDGDGATTTAGETSVFVFQSGATGAADTVVELIGLTSTTGASLVTTAAANGILLA